MTWRLKDIPRTVVVGETVWDIRFVRNIDGQKSSTKETVGLCNNDDKDICVRLGIGKHEQAKTLIHELLHAIEFEYGFSIPHELVYKLEEPIYRLLCDNWNYFQE